MSVPSREEWREALVEKQGAAVVEKLQRSTVAVCGLGGLGSNIAVSLARAGVGKLILIDFDRVEITNLQRQQYKFLQVGKTKAEALAENLREISPYVEYEPHVERITAENAAALVGAADVVCEAFDNAQAKAMLVDTVLGSFNNKFLVAASGMAGYNSANDIKTRKVGKRFYLCGDAVSEVNDAIGLIAPRVALCAAHLALMAIRLLCGMEE